MKNLVVLTGAGMSAESGISTFRDAGGLWDKYPVEQVATPEGYQRDPALVINFYNARRKQLLEVKPNRGHELLAELERISMWRLSHRMWIICTNGQEAAISFTCMVS